MRRQHPINRAAVRTAKEAQRKQKAEAKRQRKADPRAVRHDNLFPASEGTIAEGVARTLSTGLDQ